MQFPTVSHFSLLAVVVLGGGVTAAAGLASGIDELNPTRVSSIPLMDFDGLVPLNDQIVGQLIRPDDSGLVVEWEDFEGHDPGLISRRGIGDPVEFPGPRATPVPGLAAPLVVGIGCAAIGMAVRKRVR